jgi:hypothetical protein
MDNADNKTDVCPLPFPLSSPLIMLTTSGNNIHPPSHGKRHNAIPRFRRLR